MDKPTLYGDRRSGNCYKVAWLLRLTNTPFEWLETDVLQRHTRTAGFIALNPNGRVPLLVWPDGRRLAESNAILLHVSRDTGFFPRDRWEQALAWQWLFFEQYSHEPYIAVARFIVSLAHRAYQETQRLAGLMERGYQALAVMEGALQDSAYFVGDRFTVADIALYAYTHVAEEGGFDLQGYPAVRAWLDRVAALPGYLSMADACR